MGKSIESEKTSIKTVGAKKEPISSDDMRTLSNFMKKLNQDFRNETSKKVLPKIHNIIHKNKRKIYFDCRKLKEKLRICKKCDKWNNIKDITQCTICEDNYHQDCLKGQIHPNFICLECKEMSKMLKKCSKCKKEVPDKDEIGCLSCSTIYHQKCWKNKQKECKKCCILKNKIKASQSLNLNDLYKKKINEDSIRTTCSNLFSFQKLIHTEKELSKYTQSLISAIKEKDMHYSEELVNLDSFEDILNENSMDFGINHMSSQQCKAYLEYKKMPIGPYLLRQIKNKGYDVSADKDIPSGSIICEYIGEVVTLRECIELQMKSKNDSLMQLQPGRNSNETLIIRPEKFTNLARFINGVKKNSSEGNVQTMKLLCKGKPHVLLIAKRQIKKGESLCYDYNAGGIAAQYDTSYFV